MMMMNPIPNIKYLSQLKHVGEGVGVTISKATKKFHTLTNIERHWQNKQHEMINCADTGFADLETSFIQIPNKIICVVTMPISLFGLSL